MKKLWNAFSGTGSRVWKSCSPSVSFVWKAVFWRRAALLDGQLCMELEIHADGSVHATVHDADGKNIRHADPGTEDRLRTRMLRREYEEELWHVAECCFEPDFFKAAPARSLITHIRKAYGRNWNSCGGSFRGTQWCGGRIRKNGTPLFWLCRA